jgi:hypothetical protein
MAAFKPHLGRFKDDVDIVRLLDSSGPWETKSYKASGKLPACQYYTCKQKGIQLCFEQAPDKARVRACTDTDAVEGTVNDWRFAAAHLYNTNVEGFQKFQGELCLGLDFEMKNAQVV